MNELMHFIAINIISIVVVVFFATIGVILIIAFFQKRDISLWPPKISGKPISEKEINTIKNNSVEKAIKARKSVRSYQKKPVEKEKIEYLLELARLAPSASNRQEWRFIIVEDKKVISEIAKATSFVPFINEAPVVIVACAETDRHIMKCGQLSYPIDVAISLDHITLAAVEIGLGTCWIGMFDESKIKKILSVPDDKIIVAIMTLGYPKNDDIIEKNRLPLKKIIKHNKW